MKRFLSISMEYLGILCTLNRAISILYKRIQYYIETYLEHSLNSTMGNFKSIMNPSLLKNIYHIYFFLLVFSFS